MASARPEAIAAADAGPRPWRQALRLAGAILLFCMAWLYLRRWGAPFHAVYLKLLFASVAATGTALIGISFALGPLARIAPDAWRAHVSLRKHCGLLGFWLVVFHVVWALARLAPAHYGEFFGPGGALTPTAELALLAGVAALMIFSVQALASVPSIEARMQRADWLRVQRLGYAALALALAHLALLKWGGWMAVSGWRFGLPPLSLLLAAGLVLVFALRLLAAGRRSARGVEASQ